MNFESFYCFFPRQNLFTFGLNFIRLNFNLKILHADRIYIIFSVKRYQIFYICRRQSHFTGCKLKNMIRYLLTLLIHLNNKLFIYFIIVLSVSFSSLINKSLIGHIFCLFGMVTNNFAEFEEIIKLNFICLCVMFRLTKFFNLINQFFIKFR